MVAIQLRLLPSSAMVMILAKYAAGLRPDLERDMPEYLKGHPIANRLVETLRTVFELASASSVALERITGVFSDRLETVMKAAPRGDLRSFHFGFHSEDKNEH
jgi:hypothetical protein